MLAVSLLPARHMTRGGGHRRSDPEMNTCKYSQESENLFVVRYPEVVRVEEADGIVASF